MGNPNWSHKYNHGKTKVMRIPECFEEIVLYVVDKLDKKLIGDQSLENLIETYINQWREHLIHGTINGVKVDFNKQEKIDLDELLTKLTDTEKLTLVRKILN